MGTLWLQKPWPFTEQNNQEILKVEEKQVNKNRGTALFCCQVLVVHLPLFWPILRQFSGSLGSSSLHMPEAFATPWCNMGCLFCMIWRKVVLNSGRDEWGGVSLGSVNGECQWGVSIGEDVYGTWTYPCGIGFLAAEAGGLWQCNCHPSVCSVSLENQWAQDGSASSIAYHLILCITSKISLPTKTLGTTTLQSYHCPQNLYRLQTLIRGISLPINYFPAPVR